MTRSSTWIGVGAFVLAMMVTIGIDPSDENIAMGSVSLGGSPAFAQLQLPNPLDVIDDLDIDVGDAAGADDDDDDDDDGPAAGKDSDDD